MNIFVNMITNIFDFAFTLTCTVYFTLNKPKLSASICQFLIQTYLQKYLQCISLWSWLVSKH